MPTASGSKERSVRGLRGAALELREFPDLPPPSQLHVGKEFPSSDDSVCCFFQKLLWGGKVKQGRSWRLARVFQVWEGIPGIPERDNWIKPRGRIG